MRRLLLYSLCWVVTGCSPLEDPGAILAAQQRAAASSTSSGQGPTTTVDSTTAGTTSTGGALTTTTGVVASGGTTAGLGVVTQGSTTTSGTTATSGTGGTTTTSGTSATSATSTTTGGSGTTTTGGVTAGTTPKSCQDFGSFSNTPIPLSGTAKPLDLAIQDGNRAWVAWGESPAGNGTADYIYLVRADIGGTFTAVDSSTTVPGLYSDPSANYNLYPSIVLQSDSLPFVAWGGAYGGGDSVYASSLGTNGDWGPLGTSTTAEQGIGGGKQTHADLVVSSAVSPSGQLYVAWAETGDSTLRLRTYTDGAWQAVGSTETLATSVVPGSSNSAPGQIALIAPADDAVSVAWVSSAAASPNVLFLLQWNGTAWAQLGQSASSPGISSNAGGVLVDTLAMTTVPGSTNPAIVWTDNRSSGVQNVYYVHWNGSSWVPVGNSDGGTGVSGQTQYNALHPTVGIDSAGYPAIVWQQQNATANQDQIYMRRWNGVNWLSDGGSAAGAGISNNSAINIWPRVQMNGNVPIIAWQQTAAGDNGTVHVCSWR